MYLFLLPVISRQPANPYEAIVRIHINFYLITFVRILFPQDSYIMIKGKRKYEQKQINNIYSLSEQKTQSFSLFYCLSITSAF